MHIGEKIKMVRLLRKFTQEELAAKINKTRSAVSFIELTGNVNSYTLDSIAKALAITKEDLSGFDHKAILLKEPGSKNDALRAEIEAMKIRYESLAKENETLKALVKSQKKLITHLEKSKARR